jgi:hypothetical protein
MLAISGFANGLLANSPNLCPQPLSMAARIVASTFAVASPLHPPALPVRLSGVVYLSLASSSFCPMTRRVSRNGSRQRLTPSLAHRQDRPERRDLNRARKGFDPNLANLTDAAIPIVPNEADARGYTSRLCAFAAAMKLANRGCGSNGRDFSSGWNCTPMNQG